METEASEVGGGSAAAGEEGCGLVDAAGSLWGRHCTDRDFEK